MKSYIQADKLKDGSFYATEVFNNLEDHSNHWEYGDVHDGEYQIWEYPSGKIFSVRVDREVIESQHWSLPHPERWQPILELIETDSKRVRSAYDRLSHESQFGSSGR